MRAFGVVFATVMAVAAASGPARAAESCAALASLKIETTNLLSAAEVPEANGLPAYCRVLGFVRPAVNFEVRLPLQGWNGKLYMAGCGGFCGALDSDRPGFTNAMNFGLKRSYAVSTMDSGHWGSSVVDARWAMNNAVAQADWGERAVTETARVTKALVAAYYGKPQTKAYFAGCSTGGRMAAMEAIRHPTDFDGIISGAPALDYTGLVATFFAWVTKANTDADGKPILSAAKLPLIARHVYAACADKDGVVADPRVCGFHPSSLRCRADRGNDCLSEAEVGVLEKWYAGPADSRGHRLYPGGIPLGSEPHWSRWLTGAGGKPPLMPLFGQDFLRYMAFQPSAGPAYQIGAFDFDKDPERLGAEAAIYNAATFDIRKAAVAIGGMDAFAKAGGKLILYHGWADALVTPQLTVEAYEALAKRSGGLAATQTFARLFMVPGMDHCGIGTEGPGVADTGIDPLSALEQWVEQGRAPETLVATKTDKAGHTVWARAVCAYPKVARAKGGDASSAGGEACAGP